MTISANINGEGLIRQRIGEVPDALAQALLEPMRSLDRCRSEVVAIKHWDVAGVGGSEGPARYFVSLLGEAGRSVRYLPQSHFLSQGSLAPQGRGLVVFSQGLSPHAQLALAQAHKYQTCVVISAKCEEEVRQFVPASAHEAPCVLTHLPREEAGSLLRIVGPICAAALALRLAWEIAPPDSDTQSRYGSMVAAILDGYRRSARSCVALNMDALDTQNPAICLCLSSTKAAAHQLMWKWQEATCGLLPAVVDALAFAHGPFQSIYEHDAVILFICDKHTASTDRLWTSVERILSPERHQVLKLITDLPTPYSYFEYDALFLPVLARVVERRGLDLGNWPGRNADGALYELHRIDS